ncbi:MAG: hypothetical protein KAV87_50110 [Desulfobacteraceae bacterium]|nr:hypothetical protein [Desulfobacteraceae bacterium]
MNIKKGCSRCGDTFDNHFKPGHECKGYTPWVPEFKPLDTYGNWVTVSDLDRTPETQREELAALTRQIDRVLPGKPRYRRCILFTNIQDVLTLTTTITWKYTPNLAIMVEEVGKTIQFLMSVPEQTEYRIKGYPQTIGTGAGFTHHYVEKRVGNRWVYATEWMFLSSVRAQVWIDRQRKREVS